MTFVLVIIRIIAQRHHREEKIPRDTREAERRSAMYEGLQCNSTAKKFQNHASVANSQAE